MSEKGHSTPDTAGLIWAGVPLADAARVLVIVPGALTPLRVFDPLTDPVSSDTALLLLAFPGLDGRPLDRPVRVRETARHVARILNGAPHVSRIDLVGLSAGAAICLEIRGRLTCPRVTLAAISAPAPCPRVLFGVMRMGADLIAILRENMGASWTVIWHHLFLVLLFGRGAPPATLPKDDSGRPVGPSITPTPKLLLYHGAGTALWRPSSAALRARSPVCFFHGARDTVSPANAIARLARRLNAAEVQLYQDRGHLPHVLNPVLFTDIRRFWRAQKRHWAIEAGEKES
ncbi:MAG: alpha/beta hydrolase [Pseudomonadota bacterium]